MLLCTHVRGADGVVTKPVVGPGATKDEVINAYGWPNGQSQAGAKEILSYAQGEVILENGRVERVNFSPNVPWQAPKPRPAPATASTRKQPETPVDFWLTDFDAAREEARKRNSRILALFTGSDWSPASRQFHEEVEYHPDFVNAFAGDFVFLKLDFPRGNPVPVTIPEDKLKLRDLYDVTTYPTLLVLSASGELLARADLAKPMPAGSFRDRVIAAVAEARGGRPVPAQAPVQESVPEQAAPATVQTAAQGETVLPTAPAMQKASKVLLLGLVGGGLAVLFILWRMWRQPQPDVGTPVLDTAERIDAAAGGLPSTSEIADWPKEKLTAVTAGLAEFDNYMARIRPASDDVEIELRKRGDSGPRVLVCCAPGTAGVVTTRRLRELFGSMAAEGAETGWFVSPAGFAADARAYAAAHKIVLIGGDGLHNMMREVPPVSLPSLLARG